LEDEELKRIKLKKLKEYLKRMESSGTLRVLDKPVKVTDETFQSFVSKYPLVVVDCWAPWCGPCLMVAPVIEKLAKEYAGKIAFAKLNVDENVVTAQRFGIMGIPTLLVFKNGQLADKIVGAMPKSMLEMKLKKFLKT